MIFGKHINKYYLRYLHYLILGVIALLAVDIFQLKIPEIYRAVINGIEYGYVETDGGRVPFDLDYLLDSVCLPMIFIIAVMVVGRFLWRVCLFGSAIKVETDMRREMFDKSKDLSQQYYQRNKVGNLMSLYISDLETIHECFGNGALMLFDAVLMGGLAIYKMASMDLALTVLTLIPISLLLFIGTVVGKYMKQKWRIRQEAHAALSDFSQESFSGIAVIKAFCKEARELWEFKKLNKDNEHANIEHTRASTLLHVTVTLFVESVTCIILGYGGYLVYLGEFDAGSLVEFISYFTSVVWPVMAVSQLIELTSRGKASLERVSALLDEVPDVRDRDGVSELCDIRGDIELRGLTFRYPDTEYDALTDVFLKIESGESVGIIGKTGSGKTTLVDLILRTYNVPDGVLFIDGVDVNTVSIRSVREGCAYVPQDNFLFSDTIRSNIEFSGVGATEDDVTRVAKNAAVHSNIVDFSQGYDTVLGERGVTVSGGQKQRISIARALLKDAPILILDDSVSAVDTDTERLILTSLKETRRGRTTILIAHRVSTVESLDKIVLIDDGRIVAVGAHEELIAASPEYREMVELQRLDDRGEGAK